MEDGTHFEITLEFTKSLFDFEEVFVVALDTGGVGLLGSQAGVEKIPSVVGTLGGDGIGFAFPEQGAGCVHSVGEVFVGFESLESASNLAGDLLCVGFAAFGSGEFGRFGLGFGDAHFTAFLVALFAPGSSGNDVALALVFDIHKPIGVAEFELIFIGQLLKGELGTGKEQARGIGG